MLHDYSDSEDNNEGKDGDDSNGDDSQDSDSTNDDSDGDEGNDADGDDAASSDSGDGRMMTTAMSRNGPAYRNRVPAAAFIRVQ